MGVESSVPASAMIASTSMNLYEFAQWSLENTDLLHYSLDYTARNIKLYLSKNLNLQCHGRRRTSKKAMHSFMSDRLCFGCVYTEKMPSSSFKHHLVLVKTRNLYLTAEYFDSSKVHVRISPSEREVMHSRMDLKPKKSFAINREVSWLFIGCQNFTKEDYGTLTHNCRDFVKYILWWLS